MKEGKVNQAGNREILFLSIPQLFPGALHQPGTDASGQKLTQE